MLHAMKLRQTFRLRPGKTALRYLAREWGMCRFVWNEMNTQAKGIYEARPSIMLAGADPVTFGPAGADKFLTHLRATTVGEDGTYWLAEGSSVAQQQIVRDFGTSRARALKDRVEKKPVQQRAGLPGFKSKHTALPSMNYSRRGFSLKADRESGVLRLILPGKVSIPVVWSQELFSDPSSVRVYRDSLGHWYASFVVAAPATTMVPAQTHTAIGVDWGVTETATTARVSLVGSDIDEGTLFDLPHSEHGKQAAAELAKAQRNMARRRKPKGQAESHGYRLAKFKAARAQKKVARKRQDDGRKWAKKLVTEHQFIAVEDFKPKFLAKSTMARKAADAAIGATKAELIWQATKTGRDLRLVNPAFTTMDCAHCDARTKHRLPLGQRIYTCANCGVVRSRDKNSAAVMVARAGFVPADIEGVRLGAAAALLPAA